MPKAGWIGAIHPCPSCSLQLAALRWALRSSQEGMQEPGAGDWGMQSDGDGVRCVLWGPMGNEGVLGCPTG